MANMHGIDPKFMSHRLSIFPKKENVFREGTRSSETGSSLVGCRLHQGGNLSDLVVKCRDG